MVLLLSQRNYGRNRTVEILYSDDMRAEFRSDIRKYIQRLKDERSGNIRDDSPILLDILIIK